MGNLNVTEEMSDQEVEQILRSNKFHRLNYLMALEIPTYGGFKYLQFYDVIQMMTQKVVEYDYEKEKISTLKS